MIQYVCDTCSAAKTPEEVWIVGLVAEAMGVLSTRREFNIQSAWSRATAVHPLAVHFCSSQCKDQYMTWLFAPHAAVEGVTVERAVPAEVVIERVVPNKERVTTKARKTGRNKRAA